MRSVATPVDLVSVGQPRLRIEPLAQARLDKQGVDGRVRERGFLAHLDAELTEIGTATRRVTGDHAGADEQQRLASEERSHLSHERSQHAEARRGLPFVVEGGAGHVGDEALPAERIRRVGIALPRHDRVERRPAAPAQIAVMSTISDGRMWNAVISARSRCPTTVSRA